MRQGKTPLATEIGKEMATHSSIFAWAIPWTEKPGELQFTGSQRVGHDLATKQQQQTIEMFSISICSLSSPLSRAKLRLFTTSNKITTKCQSWMTTGNKSSQTSCNSVSESCSVVSDSLQPHGLYRPWNSPGQKIGVGSLSLLQEIFLIQGSNPGLLHCRRILYQLSHEGSPGILEWVAYPFLQGIFPTQELNRGFLHCRRILYQLSYQRSCNSVRYLANQSPV